MPEFYASSVAWAAVAPWAAATLTAQGTFVRQLAAVTAGNERVFRCTASGTTSATEPAWILTVNAVTSDTAVQWTEITGTASSQAAGNWTAPAARVFAFPNGRVGDGDKIYLGSDSAETTAAATTIGLASLITVGVISVNRFGATLPPVATDIQTGASINTSGANSLTIGTTAQAFVNWNNVTFNAGTTSGTATLTIGSTAGVQVGSQFNDCIFKLVGTSSSSLINLGNALPVANQGAPRLVFNNPTFLFSNSVQQIQLTGACNTEWNGGTVANSGTVPDNLFNLNVGNAGVGNVVMKGVDLTATFTTYFINQPAQCATIFVTNSKLNPATVLTSTAAKYQAWRGGGVFFDNCSSTSANLNYDFLWEMPGFRITPSLEVVRASGAGNQVTNYSWHVLISDTSNGPTRHYPAGTRLISKRINQTGNPLTVSVETLVNSATGFDNSQLYLAVEALTSSGVTLSALVNDGPANILATTTIQPVSGESWTAGVNLTPRANVHTYSQRDIISVSSNAGRVFFCTTSGLSAAAPPAAYATATDGASVVDGAATFRAAIRQTLSVSVTPKQAGILKGQVFIGTCTVTTIDLYVDPKLNVV